MITDGASTREWLTSLAGHLVLCAILGWGVLHQPPKTDEHLSIIIENPQLGAVAQVAHPQAHPNKPRVLKRAPTISMPEKETNIHDSASLAVPTVAAKSDAEAAASEGGLPAPVAEFTVTEMPELDSEVRIPYPPQARRRNAQGPIVMDLLIDDVGKVRKVTLVQGIDPDLSQAAVTAIRDFRFKPARVNEKKVAVLIRYTYRFVLDN